MAELRRGDDGIWTLHRAENERGERNEVHDEALPRYVTAFDRVFTKAEEACESEFVKALIRVGGVQDAGWDPYESTLRAIPAVIALHEQLPKGPEHFETARHLQLWTYGHIIEASEPYAIIADMLDIANGGFFKPYRFPPVPIYKARPNQPAPPTRPQFFREKLPKLERLADAAQLPVSIEPIREIWDYDLRNAVFHADYSWDAGRPGDAPGCRSELAGGDVIALGAGRSLRVIETRLQEDSEGDPVAVLVVEAA
jgi:hypothetical protein